MRPQVVNIVNFVRGVEPRHPELDLAEPVRQQLRLMKRHGLAGTFLLQYDALIRGDITAILKKETGGAAETGAWLEIVRPLAEKAGVRWKGRPGYSWDWHANAGFTIAYRPEERERILDAYMEEFRERFGTYPRSAGAWVMDAHSLAYLSERYGLSAFCICRDQWGTDGYTLWGGYYGQGYYPSRLNAFAPASSEKNRIGVPVFRMLGSDPIYQYDSGMDESFHSSDWQDVITLETVCPEGGGSPDWVRWFFRENFSGLCLSFGYAQAGQENSFGWEAMRNGYESQMEFIAKEAGAGRVTVKTLADTGAAYQSRYRQTPASAIAALSDWKNRGRRSVWYCSRFYRLNLYWENGRMWIRDLHIFDENYRERYLSGVCATEGCVYDNLPVMDGSRWSGNGVRAGIYPVAESGEELLGADPIVRETGEESLSVSWPLKAGGVFQVRLSPREMAFQTDGTGNKFRWKMKTAADRSPELSACVLQDKFLNLRHNGYGYSLKARKGCFRRGEPDGRPVLFPEDGQIVLAPEQKTEEQG